MYESTFCRDCSVTTTTAAGWAHLVHRLDEQGETLIKRNQDRLIALSRPSYLLEVGDGRKDSVTNLRGKLDGGPRAWEAGEVAEKIRQLRARYGET